MYRMKEYFEDEHTQDELARELQEVCTTVPDTLKDQCKNLMTQYGNAIVAMIVEGIRPEEMCTNLELCHHHHSELEMSPIVDNPVEELEKKDDNCATCQYVM